jgi:phosphoglycolate phosphatase-like HAD superfamily hydrolase
VDAGEPRLPEPETCEGRGWCPWNDLPETLVAAAANPTSRPVGSLQLVERYTTGSCPWDEHRRNRWAAIGRGGETGQVMDEEYRTYHERIHKRQGAVAPLVGLKQRGVFIGLLSNSEPPHVHRRLRQHGIAQRLRCGVRCGASDDEAEWRRLPGPSPKVSDPTRPDPSRTVMLRGNRLMDVLPALSAGYAHAYWVTTSRQPAPAGATKMRTGGARAALLWARRRSL